MQGLPTRIAMRPDGLYVELSDVAAAELKDPFMQETVNRVQARKSYVQISKVELGVAPPNAAPAGLIFHVARCGSTLASQLLKLQGSVVVYAEPLPINELLAPPHRWSRADLVAAARSLGALFAAHAGAAYILKLTSWNTLFCDVLVEAFPRAPWALCVRDPLEVCVSLVQNPPAWLREHELFAREIGDAPSTEARAAKLFASFCDAANRLNPARGRVIGYETMPDSIWSRLAPHFGLTVDGAATARMRSAAFVHAKSPLGKPAAFAPDAAQKRAAASQELHDAVVAHTRPAFDRLKARFSW